jgi:Carboxypeptidase regulatory-like domain
MASRWIFLVRLVSLIVCLVSAPSVLAQTGSLRGLVTDQNGAAVAEAKVTVNGLSGLLKTTTSDKSGSYSLTGLPPGDYEVQASAPNLELGEPLKISLKGGVQSLDLQLRVILAPEKVTIEENGAPSVSTDANSNSLHFQIEFAPYTQANSLKNGDGGSSPLRISWFAN